MKSRNIIFFSLFLILTSCGFNRQNATQLAGELEKIGECENIETLFWQSFHNASLYEKTPQTWDELKEALAEKSQNPALEKLVDSLSTTLTDEFWKKNPDEQTQIWAELELQITDRPGWEELQTQMSLIFKEQSSRNSKVCAVPTEPTDGNVDPIVVPTPAQPENPSIGNGTFGGRKVMAVAYQSCQAPIQKPITVATPDIVGVKISGTLSNGGMNRVIASLSDVQRTHPYLNIQNSESSCFNVNAKPLIYDFGGKPYYASASSTEMDLTKNAGSGGSVLGIDCSGLVFAAYGVQGYRLIPNKTLTASLIKGVSSRTLLNPPSAWKCVQRIEVGLNKSIEPGDVLSIDGHTVMIDELGADPFGASRFASKSECSKITENDLDFVILQSSPEKNGVGINRYQIRDYLKEKASMRVAFLKYAKSHCENVHSQTTARPQWSDVSIIRHAKTSDCVGKPLTLKYESCVQSCQF